jgi:putative CocE/NonD family hydrolase
MGPWVHGGWSRGAGDKLGDVSFNAKTGEFYREQIEFPFFEHHLKGKGEGKHPKAWVFETGTNVWRRYDAWPPKEARAESFHFRRGSQLGAPLDGTESTTDITSWDEYVSDPAKPVPFINKTGTGMFQEYMTADQRFASQRPDVLVYQTPVLDKDLIIAGPIEVELYVSTTGTDADWVVKLIDVYPDDFPDPDPNPAGGSPSRSSPARWRR